MVNDGIQDNRYFCRNCNSKQNGKKQLKMDISPQVLVISLKRFWWDYRAHIPGSNQGQRHKIYHRVKAPFMLDTVRLKIGTAYYMLMGVAVHSGDANHGHYFSVTRSLSDALTAYSTRDYSFGTWDKQSDTYISANLSKVDINNFTSGRQETTPYQYYYKRVDSISTAPTIVVPTNMDIPQPVFDINMNDDCNVTFDPNEWTGDIDDHKCKDNNKHYII